MTRWLYPDDQGIDLCCALYALAEHLWTQHGPEHVIYKGYVLGADTIATLDGYVIAICHN